MLGAEHFITFCAASKYFVSVCAALPTQRLPYAAELEAVRNSTQELNSQIVAALGRTEMDMAEYETLQNLVRY